MYRLTRFCVLVILLISSGLTWTANTPAAASERVSAWVWAATENGDTSDFVVVLAEQADLQAAYTLPTKQVRGRFVYQTLWDTAQRSQAPLRAWLEARHIPYRSFYIVNMLHILRGDRVLVQTLAARSDVARIEANPHIQNIALPLQDTATWAARPTLSIEWNITKVQANAVWQLGYTGQGIVVGGQDTGYDWDHPALKSQYRGWDGAAAHHDYNWHDAIHSSGSSCGTDSPTPCDDYGHGTHTMGIAVGSTAPTTPLTATRAIGVAPGARWIGCRNMNNGVGTPTTYLECFEFFLAPYPVGGTPAQGNPDLAPDVTNNSWGCPTSEGCDWNTLQAAVEAQHAAGIMTVVSAGNSGPSCSTVREPPSIYAAAYTVGATNSSDAIVSFSSRGPVTVDGSGRRKPDLTAPGQSIVSSLNGGSYGAMSGTSMAAPHVAGAVALLWSARPDLRGQITQTEHMLNAAAVPLYSTQCGDPANTVPNHVFGWGRLDVLAAVEPALIGHLVGVVSAPDQTPLAGVTVTAQLDSAHTWTAISDSEGNYGLSLRAGIYTLTAQADGYPLYQTNSIVITAAQTTTQHIAMSALPCIPPTAVAIQGPSSGLPGVYTFTAPWQPLTATLPIALQWDNGDTTSSSQRSWSQTGVYTLSVTATGCAASITDTHTITLTDEPPPCIALTSVRIGWQPAQPRAGETITLTAQNMQPLTATRPITWSWQWSDGITVGGAQITRTLLDASVYTATLTAQNCAAALPVYDTAAIVVTERHFWLYLPILIK